MQSSITVNSEVPPVVIRRTQDNQTNHYVNQDQMIDDDFNIEPSELNINDNEAQTVPLNSNNNNFKETKSQDAQTDKTTQPKHYLIWSIINIIFFNTILGIIALVFSIKTRKKIKANKIVEAKANSKVAKILNIVSTSLGVVSILLFMAKLFFNSVFSIFKPSN